MSQSDKPAVPAYGGMTKLPDGTHGNFPAKVHVEEVFARSDGFTPPYVLTKSQLLEQIGPELYEQDVLWYVSVYSYLMPLVHHVKFQPLI